MKNYIIGIFGRRNQSNDYLKIYKLNNPSIIEKDPISFIEYDWILLYTSILYEFMDKVMFTPKFKVLEHLHQNFDFILKKESDGGIITIDTLEYYLNATIDRGSIKVTEFISQLIEFPKYDLDDLPNEN
ncbi:hypothetical protein ACTFIZ_001912 [Dictyostelium cf. discoideum]